MSAFAVQRSTRCGSFPKYMQSFWTHFKALMKMQFREQGWHSRFVRGLGARGPEFDSRISHPCFDFFRFRVAK